jgi:hypothetical protein
MTRAEFNRELDVIAALETPAIVKFALRILLVVESEGLSYAEARAALFKCASAYPAPPRTSSHPSARLPPPRVSRRAAMAGNRRSR